MDTDQIIKIMGIILAPIILFGGTWLTVRQARRQQKDTNTIAKWDTYTGRIEGRLDTVNLKYDALEKKLDTVQKKWEWERKLRIGYQEFVQRTIFHFHKSPKCKEEIGPLSNLLREHMDSKTS